MWHGAKPPFAQVDGLPLCLPPSNSAILRASSDRAEHLTDLIVVNRRAQNRLDPTQVAELVAAYIGGDAANELARRPCAEPWSKQAFPSARVLGQKRGPDVVIVGVLCVALLFGLIGLAVHLLWVVAIIVMALGLGYTVDNSRRNRIDVVNQRAEGQPERVDEPR